MTVKALQTAERMNKISNFWDKEVVVGEVMKNNRGETIRIRSCEKRKQGYIDVRTMYPDREGKLLPGKGVTIPLHIANEICSLMLEAIEYTNNDELVLLERIARSIDSQ